MRNFVFGIILVSVLFSCNESKEKKVQKTARIANKAAVKDSVVESEIVSNEEFKNEFDILLPRSYRTYGNKNPANLLSEKWIELYEENGTYYLGKADFKTEKDFDECTGDSLVSISPKNKVIVFMNDPELKSGKLNSLKIKKHKIWPKEKATYVFNGVNYVFRAEGKVLSEYKIDTDVDGDEVFKNVSHYKLYLTIGNSAEKLLLAEDSFHDTFVALIFAGDIDGDGKLDFVFNASRDYEEERAILFLSSKAENEESVKKVSEIAVQFDC